MIEIYKCLIKTITESDKQQIVTAIGRAGEEITARSSVQHVGFHSTPKEGDIGVIVADGDNITMIASFDSADDRPDDLADTTTIYESKDNYVKITDSGKITVANANNKIILKSNGDIELGEGSLKALVTDNLIDSLNTMTLPVVIATLTAGPLITPLVKSQYTTTKTKAV